MAATEIVLTRIPLSGGVELPTLAALNAEGAKIPFPSPEVHEKRALKTGWLP